MINERLQQLRDILYQSPSKENWAALWNLLDTWPEDEDPQIAVDYVQDHLDRWPDALKTPPKGWAPPPGRDLHDPRLQLLTDDARETLIANTLALSDLNSPALVRRVRHVCKTQEGSARVLWRLFRSGHFAPAEALDDWDALMRAGDTVDGEGFMALLRRFEGLGAEVLPFSSPWMRWDWRLEHLLIGIDGDKLQPLIDGWQHLDSNLMWGLGYALARRGALSADELGPDAVERIARHVVSQSGSGAQWLQARGVWPEAMWGRALILAFERRDRSGHSREVPLLLEALPHTTPDTEQWVAHLLLEGLVRGSLENLPSTLEKLDAASAVIRKHFDSYLEPTLTHKGGDHAPPYLRGGAGLNLIVWRALRDGGLDPRFDVLLSDIPMFAEDLYCPFDELRAALELLISALQTLSRPRLNGIFKAWNDHIQHKPQRAFQRWVIAVMSGSGEQGRDALLALSERLNPGKSDPWKLSWLLVGLVEAGATLTAVHERMLRRAVKRADPDIVPALTSLPVARQEKVLLSGGVTRWFYIPHVPTPRLINKVIRTVVGWPRGRHDDEMQARETLLALGDKALPALSKALIEETAPHRELLLDTLLALDSPEIAPTLLHLLGDTRKDIRGGAIRGLVTLGEGAVIERLEGLLTSRKKTARLASAEALSRLPSSPALAALAARHLPSTKDPGVRACLSMLQTTLARPETPIDAGRQRRDALPESVVKAAEKAMASSGPLSETPLAKEDELWLLWAVWRRRAARPDPMTWNERGRWLELEEPHLRDPHLPWVIVDVLANAGRELEDFFKGQISLLSGNPETERAICHALTTGLPAHRKPLYQWLADRPSALTAPVFFRGLSDDLANVRRWCVAALARLPVESLSPAIDLIAQGSGPARIAAADLLEAAPDPRWISALEEALATKVPAKLRRAIDAALLRCRLSRIVPEGGAFESAAHRVDLALAEALAEAPSPSRPFLPTPPPLALRSGVPLCERGALWWIGQLAMDRVEHRDKLTLAIRNRLNDPCATALADALFETFIAAGSQGR